MKTLKNNRMQICSSLMFLGSATFYVVAVIHIIALNNAGLINLLN
jgi:hypothetical protein